MYQRPTLSLSQVRAAMNAMLDKAQQEPDRPLAIAIVDADAKMLSYARMDNCRALPQRMAVSKAYTSAMSGSDSDAYAQRLKNEGRNIADFGDSHSWWPSRAPSWSATPRPTRSSAPSASAASPPRRTRTWHDWERNRWGCSLLNDAGAGHRENAAMSTVSAAAHVVGAQPLIQRLQVSGMLSFGPEGVDLPMERLNVLIGPNGSGKSNFIEALALLQAAPHDLSAPVRRMGGISEWLWKGDSELKLAAVGAIITYPTGSKPLRHTLLMWSAGGTVRGRGLNTLGDYRYNLDDEPSNDYYVSTDGQSRDQRTS